MANFKYIDVADSANTSSYVPKYGRTDQYNATADNAPFLKLDDRSDWMANLIQSMGQVFMGKNTSSDLPPYTLVGINPDGTISPIIPVGGTFNLADDQTPGIIYPMGDEGHISYMKNEAGTDYYYYYVVISSHLLAFPIGTVEATSLFQKVEWTAPSAGKREYNDYRPGDYLFYIARTSDYGTSLKFAAMPKEVDTSSIAIDVNGIPAVLLDQLDGQALMLGQIVAVTGTEYVVSFGYSPMYGTGVTDAFYHAALNDITYPPQYPDKPDTWNFDHYGYISKVLAVPGEKIITGTLAPSPGDLVELIATPNPSQPTVPYYVYAKSQATPGAVLGGIYIGDYSGYHYILVRGLLDPRSTGLNIKLRFLEGTNFTTQEVLGKYVWDGGKPGDTDRYGKATFTRPDYIVNNPSPVDIRYLGMVIKHTPNPGGIDDVYIYVKVENGINAAIEHAIDTYKSALIPREDVSSLDVQDKAVNATVFAENGSTAEEELESLARTQPFRFRRVHADSSVNIVHLAELIQTDGSAKDWFAISESSFYNDMNWDLGYRHRDLGLTLDELKTQTNNEYANFQSTSISNNPACGDYPDYNPFEDGQIAYDTAYYDPREAPDPVVPGVLYGDNWQPYKNAGPSAVGGFRGGNRDWMSCRDLTIESITSGFATAPYIEVTNLIGGEFEGDYSIGCTTVTDAGYETSLVPNTILVPGEGVHILRQSFSRAEIGDPIPKAVPYSFNDLVDGIPPGTYEYAMTAVFNPGPPVPVYSSVQGSRTSCTIPETIRRATNGTSVLQVDYPGPLTDTYTCTDPDASGNFWNVVTGNPWPEDLPASSNFCFIKDDYYIDTATGVDSTFDKKMKVFVDIQHSTWAVECEYDDIVTVPLTHTKRIFRASGSGTFTFDSTTRQLALEIPLLGYIEGTVTYIDSYLETLYDLHVGETIKLKSLLIVLSEEETVDLASVYVTWSTPLMASTTATYSGTADAGNNDGFVLYGTTKWKDYQFVGDFVRILTGTGAATSWEVTNNTVDVVITNRTATSNVFSNGTSVAFYGTSGLATGGGGNDIVDGLASYNILNDAFDGYWAIITPAPLPGVANPPVYIFDTVSPDTFTIGTPAGAVVGFGAVVGDSYRIYKDAGTTTVTFDDHVTITTTSPPTIPTEHEVWVANELADHWLIPTAAAQTSLIGRCILITSNTTDSLWFDAQDVTFTIGDTFVVNVGGVCSSGTLTSITDALKTWEVDQWVGWTLEIMDGPYAGTTGTILRNSTDTLQISNLGVDPTGYRYQILFSLDQTSTYGTVLATDTAPPCTTDYIEVTPDPLWTVDQWAGAYVIITDPPGIGPAENEQSLVLSNTSNSLTLQTGLSAAPDTRTVRLVLVKTQTDGFDRTLADVTGGWGLDAYLGDYLVIKSGPSTGKTVLIAGNSADVLTFAPRGSGFTVDNTTDFDIIDSGDMASVNYYTLFRQSTTDAGYSSETSVVVNPLLLASGWRDYISPGGEPVPATGKGAAGQVYFLGTGAATGLDDHPLGYYRYVVEYEWASDPPELGLTGGGYPYRYSTSATDSGTCTGSLPGPVIWTTLQDSTRTWTVNQWQNATVRITDGTLAGEERTVSSNTATELTVADWGSDPTGMSYVILNAADYELNIGWNVLNVSDDRLPEKVNVYRKVTLDSSWDARGSDNLYYKIAEFVNTDSEFLLGQYSDDIPVFNATTRLTADYLDPAPTDTTFGGIKFDLNGPVFPVDSIVVDGHTVTRSINSYRLYHVNNFTGIPSDFRLSSDPNNPYPSEKIGITDKWHNLGDCLLSSIVIDDEVSPPATNLSGTDAPFMKLTMPIASNPLPWWDMDLFYPLSGQVEPNVGASNPRLTDYYAYRGDNAIPWCGLASLICLDPENPPEVIGITPTDESLAQIGNMIFSYDGFSIGYDGIGNSEFTFHNINPRVGGPLVTSPNFDPTSGSGEWPEGVAETPNNYIWKVLPLPVGGLRLRLKGAGTFSKFEITPNNLLGSPSKYYKWPDLKKNGTFILGDPGKIENPEIDHHNCRPHYGITTDATFDALTGEGSISFATSTSLPSNFSFDQSLKYSWIFGAGLGSGVIASNTTDSSVTPNINSIEYTSPGTGLVLGENFVVSYGRATNGGGVTLEDSTKNWVPNSLVGKLIVKTFDVGAGLPPSLEVGYISSNDATTITFGAVGAGPWLSPTFALGDGYDIADGYATYGNHKTLQTSALIRPWTENELVGFKLRLLSGLAGAARVNFQGYEFVIASNTVDTITFTNPYYTSSALDPKVDQWTLYTLSKDSGVASTGTTSTLTDPTKAWEVGSQSGKIVTFTTGLNSGTSSEVLDNTATTLTFTPLSNSVSAGDWYEFHYTNTFGAMATVSSSLIESHYGWDGLDDSSKDAWWAGVGLHRDPTVDRGWVYGADEEDFDLTFAYKYPIDYVPSDPIETLNVSDITSTEIDSITPTVGAISKTYPHPGNLINPMSAFEATPGDPANRVLVGVRHVNPTDSGTGIITTTTITDLAKNWRPNALVGYNVYVVMPCAVLPCLTDLTAQIVSNTATELTLSPALVAPPASATYIISNDGTLAFDFVLSDSGGRGHGAATNLAQLIIDQGKAESVKGTKLSLDLDSTDPLINSLNGMTILGAVGTRMLKEGGVDSMLCLTVYCAANSEQIKAFRTNTTDSGYPVEAFPAYYSDLNGIRARFPWTVALGSYLPFGWSLYTTNDDIVDAPSIIAINNKEVWIDVSKKASYRTYSILFEVTGSSEYDFIEATIAQSTFNDGHHYLKSFEIGTEVLRYLSEGSAVNIYVKPVSTSPSTTSYRTPILGQST